MMKCKIREITRHYFLKSLDARGEIGEHNDTKSNHTCVTNSISNV